MAHRVTLDLPDDLAFALSVPPESFVSEMRLAAAAKWYELGLLTQGKAAEVAGMSRAAFLTALGRLQISPFQTSAAEVIAEATGG